MLGLAGWAKSVLDGLKVDGKKSRRRGLRVNLSRAGVRKSRQGLERNRMRGIPEADNNACPIPVAL